MASRKPLPISAADRRTVRCAIYTRKSTEEGLDQEFNSLDAQREACAAYILSQRHEGWTLVDELYDDGGFSGGNMDRPGLKQLLADVATDRVDVIVVYKVDRLTRALSDFAKIVDVLDAKGASFVSITQSFNTTTSMGRLTLNVLLSFAQFEREVIGERVRDKVAASKRKGMWMGGPVPFGYDVIDRKLIANAEAPTVCRIMQRYLDLGSVKLLVEELAAQGVKTKASISRSGVSRGGVPFSRGPLYHLLANTIYIGRVAHRGETFEGCHEAIVSQDLFDRVQAQLKANAVARTLPTNTINLSPLAGLIRDHLDRPMTPEHASRQSIRYRYYRSTMDARGAARRIAADQPERAVVDGLAALLQSPIELLNVLEPISASAAISDAPIRAREVSAALHDSSPFELRSLMLELDVKVVIGEEQITTTISAAALARKLELTCHSDDGLRITLQAASVDRSRGNGVRVRIEADGPSGPAPDGRLLMLIVKARAARDALADGSAELERADVHQATRLARLAYLAPDIIAAVLDGSQPPSLSSRKLLRVPDLPLDWTAQRRLLGFAPNI